MPLKQSELSHWLAEKMYGNFGFGMVLVPFWGVETPWLRCCAVVIRTLRPMVGEAAVHVQGESLKTAAFP